MRVLVTGGRDLDHSKVCAWLFKNASEMIGEGPHYVIDGGELGADHGARLWRDANRGGGRTCFADHKSHGATAISFNNARMLREAKPEVVIAFPGGDDMVDRARSAGVRVIEAAGDFGKAGAK